jgi:hypothetical protein
MYILDVLSAGRKQKTRAKARMESLGGPNREGNRLAVTLRRLNTCWKGSQSAVGRSSHVRDDQKHREHQRHAPDLHPIACECRRQMAPSMVG